MRVSAALPTGVAALLFESARRRRDAEERLVARLREAGYSEVILPILDYLEPYESLLTPATRGELYRFVDRDGELLALRADFTPMLARLLAPRLASLALPLRLYYRGDMVAIRRSGRGGRGSSISSAPSSSGLAGEQAEREVLRLFLELATAGDGGGASRWCSASPARSTGCCWRRAGAIPCGWRRRWRGASAGRCGGRPHAPRRGGERRPGSAGGSGTARRRAGCVSLQALRDELAADFPRCC